MLLCCSANIWQSVGVVSSGDYGVPEGLVFSMPVQCVEGKWEVVKGIEVPTNIQVSENYIAILSSFESLVPHETCFRVAVHAIKRQPL